MPKHRHAEFRYEQQRELDQESSSYLYPLGQVPQQFVAPITGRLHQQYQVGTRRKLTALMKRLTTMHALIRYTVNDNKIDPREKLILLRDYKRIIDITALTIRNIYTALSRCNSWAAGLIGLAVLESALRLFQ